MNSQETFPPESLISLDTGREQRALDSEGPLSVPFEILKREWEPFIITVLLCAAGWQTVTYAFLFTMLLEGSIPGFPERSCQVCHCWWTHWITHTAQNSLTSPLATEAPLPGHRRRLFACASSPLFNSRLLLRGNPEFLVANCGVILFAQGALPGSGGVMSPNQFSHNFMSRSSSYIPWQGNQSPDKRNPVWLGQILFF